jgi:hypothetical protein
MNSRAPGLVARRRLQVLPLNLFVVQEDVVEGAVDDRVEPILEPVESCCIRDPEVDRRAGTLRVAFGPINRRPGAVNARCHIALRREVDRVMARTRSRVEDFSKHHRPPAVGPPAALRRCPTAMRRIFHKTPGFCCRGTAHSTGAPSRASTALASASRRAAWGRGCIARHYGNCGSSSKLRQPPFGIGAVFTDPASKACSQCGQMKHRLSVVVVAGPTAT